MKKLIDNKINLSSIVTKKLSNLLMGFNNKVIKN